MPLSRIILSSLFLLILNVSQFTEAANNLNVANKPELQNDFKEQQAQVVLVEGDTAYVNIGEDKNIKVGALFVLVEQKNKDLPIESNVGVYRVVQLKKNFCLIKAINTKRPISVGEKVISNHNLNVSYIDVNGDSEASYLKFKRYLPHLIWNNYQSAKDELHLTSLIEENKNNADLYFIANNGVLEVRDRDQQLVFQYQMHAPEQTYSNLLKSPILTGNQQKLPRDEPGIVIGSINLKINSSDFVSYKDEVYLLASNENSLQIYTLDSQAKLIAELSDAFSGNIIETGWWQPDINSRPKIVVSVWQNKDLSSSSNLLESYLVDFDGKNLRIQVSNIDYLMKSYDLNNDGSKELLLAQSYSNEDFFGSKIKQVTYKKGQLNFVNPQIKLPQNFIITGSAISDLNNDGILETITVNQGRLQISSGTVIKLRKKQGYGGSTTFILYEMDPEAIDSLHDTTTIEVSPISIDLNKDGTREFVLPRVNDSSSGFSLGGTLNYNYTLEAFYLSSAGHFQSVPLAVNVFGRIQGLASFKHQIWLVVTDVEASASGEGQTLIKRFSM